MSDSIQRPIVPIVAHAEYNAVTTSPNKGPFLPALASAITALFMYFTDTRKILEFAEMLKVTAEKLPWRGFHFFAYSDRDQPDRLFNFQRSADETTFGFSAEEWERLDRFM